MDGPFEPISPEWQEWLSDLKQREARGEVRVAWSRAREPSCVHSTSIDQPTQPASACLYCKDSDRLREWRDYWRSLGAPIT